MRKTPKNLNEFIDLLKQRHALIMFGRPEMHPGEFKTKSNRVGSTVFVEPELVYGTLCMGYEFYQSLETAFQRAVFMMFLVSEVHPFSDGNGRTARVMMNSELVALGEMRIIIPIVFRNNYLAALRALSLNKYPEPLIRTLDFARNWALSINWHDLAIAKKALEQCNTLLDPGYADENGLRLQMPLF